MRLRTRVNGSEVETEITALSSLLEVIRTLGLTGTKEGCRIGVCGLCTVLVDDLPVSSCLYLAACAEGAEIWTVEGVATEHPDLVDAFVGCEGMQCGICTPGQIVTAGALARAVAAGRAEGAVGAAGGGLSEADIRHYFDGNLCRCTGYATIVEAVKTYLDN